MMTHLIAWLDQWSGLIALQVAVAVTLMLVVALLVNWVLRRSAASLRHRVWALAILSLLAYPLVQPLLPKFSLGLPMASPENLSDTGPTAINPPELPSFARSVLPVQDQRFVDEIATHARQSTGPLPMPKPQTVDDSSIRLPIAEAPARATMFHWPSILVAIWAMGIAIGLGFLVKVHLAAWRLVRTATIPSDPSWTAMAGAVAAQLGVRRRVAVRISDRIAVPVTAAWLRPVILLPTECDGWAESRRRMVLIHELSHVARGDVLWQTAAKLACVIYWLHPLVWLAARRMRVEREAACDDVVLRDVERPSEYASLLLDVAASLADRPIGMSTAAIAMACGRSVEERIRRIVQPGRCRLPIGRRTARWFSVGAILIVLGLGSINIFADPPMPAASAASASAVHTEKTPAKAGNHGPTPEAEKKFEPFATLECSGVSGGIGGILYSTGFTFVKSSEPNAKKTRLIVSFASDQSDDNVANYRVMAISKDGRTFSNESSECSSGRGRKTGVMTIICEFPVSDSNLEKLRIERLKDAKSTGQSKGHPVSHAVTKHQNSTRFHLVRGNTTWIGTDNAPLQYNDYDKLCFWLWDSHTVVLPMPGRGFFDFYGQRTLLRPSGGRVDHFRAEKLAGQPANITMPGAIDLPTYQLLLQPSVQRALNLSNEQRTKLQDISAKYWPERRQIAGKALDDMEAQAQRELAAELAKVGGPGLVRSGHSPPVGNTSPFSEEVIQKLEAQWNNARKQIEDVLTPEHLQTLKDLTFRTFAFGSGVMFEPKVLERLSVTKDQQAKLQALELQLQKEKDHRLRSATAEKMKKILAVLTPEQLSELRKKQPLEQYTDCSTYPYPMLPQLYTSMPDSGAAEELGLSAKQVALVRHIVHRHQQSRLAMREDERKLATGDEKGRQTISEKRRQEMTNLRKQIEKALTPEQWARCNEIAFENLAIPYLRIVVSQASGEAGLAKRMAVAVSVAFGLGLNSEQVTALREIDAAYFDKPEQIYRDLTDKALTAFTPAQQEKLRAEVDRRGW